MTNKKYIRTMSDEELVDWIHINVNFCFNCPARSECFSHTHSHLDCKNNIRKWLNSEVE